MTRTLRRTLAGLAAAVALAVPGLSVPGLSVSGLSVPGAAWAANSWGLPGEVEARFDATVTDVLCVLKGDCPEDCGAGKRLLGLLQDDGTLVLPLKNAGPFTGATADLIPFCNRKVTVDGLFTTNYGVTTFAVQFVRPEGGKWRGANGFVRAWAREHGLEPKDKKARQWFRHDEAIRALIEEQGVLGLKKQGITP